MGRACRDAQALTQAHRDTRMARGSTRPGGQKRRQETQSTWRCKGTCSWPFLPTPLRLSALGYLSLQPCRGLSEHCLHPSSRTGRLRSSVHRCRCPRPPRNWAPLSYRLHGQRRGKLGRRQPVLQTAPRSHGLSSERFRAAVRSTPFKPIALRIASSHHRLSWARFLTEGPPGF